MQIKLQEVTSAASEVDERYW